ncbi:MULTISPECIES: DEAD/DEAH box helicase [unclassified Mucilaginibacter]|uniref:DEAD/DEAH box helicase n=3 Tax=Mucilaginibacter TaxID=423349 RepID=UPI002AC9D0E6|nr:MULTISPECIES: DEAD/DEAH box helicase [unclassified Mucilaginibacter]MEB0278822.1 DEAD/DEAH box helicase [Mucilaginibacter sp. 10B2]MEB0299813.1 DEAD/DEAH box helicase [Mucilaginibacter sp. 5C4]WPX22004.1 DEAD/DEAH box helicase [Mucilaginibacter sp. 5C4]
MSNVQDNHITDRVFILRGISFQNITEVIIAKNTASGAYPDADQYKDISPKHIAVNEGVFINQANGIFPPVGVLQQADGLLFTCNCDTPPGKLCEHQSLVLGAITRRDELGIFFNNKLRHEKLKRSAYDYGLEKEPDLDRYFKLDYQHKVISVSPVSTSLMPVTKESLSSLNDLIIPSVHQPVKDDERTICVVIKQHKYYQYLFIELYLAQTTKEGKIKNPMAAVNPLDLIWETEDNHRLKFYTGVNKFQNHLNSKRTEADIKALRAIVKNTPDYPFYYHDNTLSENITATSVVPVKMALLPHDVKLTVDSKGQFFEILGSVKIGKTDHPLKYLDLRFNYFVLLNDTLYLVDNLQVLALIDLLKKRPDNLLVHQSKFGEFKSEFLSKLEDNILIAYKHVKPATPVQLQQQGFAKETEQIIYLSDFGSHVMLLPVMRYGEAEIPVRTKRMIYGKDAKGKEFLVDRNEEAELAFTALLIKQHPWFPEQLEGDDLPYFYLHKRYFLQEDWFLNVFEDWKANNITVLGFNELEGNKLNPNKVNITIRVLSGINWFNTEVNVRFGRKRAALKQVNKAVRNKSKYVQLDDGTMGILPAEWIEKFAEYFNSGEIVDDMLQIPKTNFQTVSELFDDTMLDEEAKIDIQNLQLKVMDFDALQEVPISPDFTGTLRPYQHQGLNWLNLLDDLNFGGCLADDMGLGKTLQIIAFILSQRDKVKHNTNLLVVPTSLIFNWQMELKKFAPSIRIHTTYGADRIKNTDEFDTFEVILTSYGTLLTDVNFLKSYRFNYIFLDESQAIKNPDSQRYKAVRLLKTRNRIVITGTPIENNTFDLYGQLSFACPGLLGTKQYFKDIYAVPIDKFKSNKRAAELQTKIKPFILRRTKQQVAEELPEKTEMVLYCEMQPQQSGIYDAYEKEFREYISATTDDVLKRSPMNVLKGLTRLRQICDSPMLLTGDKPPGGESAKIDILIEQIESKSPQHKILVFSQFVTMLELIKKELIARNIKYSWLTGSSRNREATVNNFQNNPGIRVFLISLKAGGVGLNLTEADYVYLVDPWWNPAVENQAIDRSHRIGQNNNVVAVRLICPNTVEEKIMEMQVAKQQLVKDLIKTDTSFLQSFSKADLLGLLRK